MMDQMISRICLNLVLYGTMNRMMMDDNNLKGE